MGSPGVPCVLLDHWNTNKAAISAMIAARRVVKVHSESAVTVNQSAANIYVATITGLNGTLIVKIGSGNYSAPADYTLATSGTDYAIWTKIINPVAPSITVSPSGGTYYSAQTVTLSTSTGATVYYTTNNTAPTNTSNLYSQPLNISANTTLRAIAYNPTTQLYSNESTQNYIINTLPPAIKVRFKVPTGWTACKVYSWVGSTPLTGAWPGTAMTLENDGYYSYIISGFTTVPIGVVFNNGVGTSPPQTVDLSATTDMCWDAGALVNGKYTAIPVICPPTSVDENSVDNSWRFYPNPTHDKIFITMPNGVKEITVFSALGKACMVKPIFSNNSCTIDLTAYPPGMYYITLSGVDGKRVSKAVMKY
jgi:alpha-amylase